jgi:hypothetical protein
MKRFAGRCVFLLLVSMLSQLHGQTVQLPEFHIFSTTGGVLVPDRGQASLGAVHRGYSSIVRRGVPLRGHGLDRIGQRFAGTAGASVTATVIDLDEMDRQTLASANSSRKRSTTTENLVRARASFIRQNIARRTPGLPARSNNRRQRTMDR